jgi:hypothetical protein
VHGRGTHKAPLLIIHGGEPAQSLTSLAPARMIKTVGFLKHGWNHRLQGIASKAADIAHAGFSRSARIPSLDSDGMTCWNSSKRLPQISNPGSTLTPMRFPPGRAKLGTSPSATGSLVTATMGIVDVACSRSLAAADGTG